MGCRPLIVRAVGRLEGPAGGPGGSPWPAGPVPRLIGWSRPQLVQEAAGGQAEGRMAGCPALDDPLEITVMKSGTALYHSPTNRSHKHLSPPAKVRGCPACS